ncbi:hypothetical protein D1872_174740 [compost metagenome]
MLAAVASGFDIKGLVDMNYFWWVFNKIVAAGIIFFVIFIAIKAAGWLLEALISAFKKMGS